MGLEGALFLGEGHLFIIHGEARRAAICVLHGGPSRGGAGRARVGAAVDIDNARDVDLGAGAARASGGGLCWHKTKGD